MKNSQNREKIIKYFESEEAEELVRPERGIRGDTEERIRFAHSFFDDEELIPAEKSFHEDISERSERADELLRMVRGKMEEKNTRAATVREHSEAYEYDGDVFEDVDTGYGIHADIDARGEYFDIGAAQGAEYPDLSYTGGGVFGLDTQPEAGSAPFARDEYTARRYAPEYTENTVSEDGYRDIFEEPEHIIRVRGTGGIGSYYRTEQEIIKDAPRYVPSMYSDEKIDELSSPSASALFPSYENELGDYGYDSYSREDEYAHRHGETEPYGDELSDIYYESERHADVRDYVDVRDHTDIRDYTDSELASDELFFDEDTDTRIPEERAYESASDYREASELTYYDDSEFGFRDASRGEERLYTSYLDDELSYTDVNTYEESLGLNESRAYRDAELRRADTQQIGGEYFDASPYDGDKSAALLYLKESKRRVAEYRRELKRKERMRRKHRYGSELEFIADKLNINKAILDERAESLAVICHSGLKFRKHGAKRRLLYEIGEYNLAVSEYERLTGYKLAEASRSIPKDIIAGRPYQRLPKISYIDETNIPSGYSIEGMTRSERREYRREQVRLAKECESEEKRLRRLTSKRRGERYFTDGKELSELSARIDGGVTAVEKRINAQIEEYEKKKDLTEYTYSADHTAKRELIRECNREIKRLERSRRGALKDERRDSERYYAALISSPDDSVVRRRSKRDKLESLSMRLETLLLERERIDSQLTKLYSAGNTSKRDTGKGLIRVCRRTARRIKGYFRRDMRILDKRIPLDVKEKIAKCCNRMISAEVEIADLRYRLRHYGLRGEAVSDAKRTIRENKASLRRYRRDYRRFLKRGRSYVERERGVKIQIIWVLSALAAAALIGTALYFILR